MEATPKFVSPRSMWVSKLTLRCVTIVFDVIALGLAGSGLGFGFLMIGPPALVSLCWCVAELICIVKRGGHRGIHPGANVGMDLVLWLGLMACTIMYGLFGPIYSYSYSRNGYRVSDFQATAIAIVSFGSLLIILHFTTFIIACRETNLRNRLLGPTILVMQNPPNGTLPPGGHMQPLPGGQVYFQVFPGANGLPQQQVYYVPVQAMPGSQVAPPLQTVLSPPAPAAVARNAVA